MSPVQSAEALLAALTPRDRAMIEYQASLDIEAFEATTAEHVEAMAKNLRASPWTYSDGRETGILIGAALTLKAHQMAAN